ncbi:MAG: dihydrofolate reductase [Bdellovibrionales bacterium]|nr:dihydrofolate reductase [Bdellovibrionales bacterium]MBT3527284.1 dihydrofolate reductase [Bdellovibrionales bacterium]MBT7765953.1 dihydrofolate reductase [Bdellovibrionales bacterium]
MKISIIVAVGQSGQIGLKGQLPWHLPEDLKNFRQITMGHHIVMGRKTFESIGRPLPGRKMVVISRDPKYHHSALASSYCDLSLAIDEIKASGESELFVIGGGQIYQSALPLADRLYLTQTKYDGEADVCFPAWQELNSRFAKVVHQEDFTSFCFQIREVS